MGFMSLRAMFLITFVIAMPILALPPVARRIDELLYGTPPAGFGQPPKVAPAPTREASPVKHEGVSQAGYEQPEYGQLANGQHSPAAGAIEPTAAAVEPAAYVQNESPPLLAPTPQFNPLTPPAGEAPASGQATATIDDQKIFQLQQIRARLEELGADYVIVEIQEGGRYRFNCQMLIDGNSRFTKPFEASAFDPVTAGAEVLRAVEAWRSAAQGGQRLP